MASAWLEHLRAQQALQAAERRSARCRLTAEQQENVIRRWHSGELGQQETWKQLRCSPGTLRARARALGLDPDARVHHKPKHAKITAEQLREEVAARTPAEQIMTKYKIKSLNSLKVIAGRHCVSLDGLIKHGRVPSGKLRVFTPEEHEVIRRWHRRETTLAAARLELGCSNDRFYREAHAMGLSTVRPKPDSADAPPAVASAANVSHGNSDVMMLSPDEPPLWDAGSLTVHALGEDPYLAALRRVHTVPRDEVYPGLQRKREWPKHLRAVA